MGRFRLPALDHGVVSFLWAAGLGVYIWLLGLAVGFGKSTSVILAAVSACAIFLLVRLYGEDDYPN